MLSFPGSHLVLASDPVAALLLALRQPGCARDDALSLWIPMLPLWLASLYCWLIGKESRFLLSFPSPNACSERGSRMLESFLSSRGWDPGPVYSGWAPMALEGEVAGDKWGSSGLSKNLALQKSFLQKTGEGGVCVCVSGEAGYQPPHCSRQHVFIVMQISSCNLGQVQVHPVLVVRTENRMSWLLLTALNALFFCCNHRACLVTGLLLCL